MNWIRYGMCVGVIGWLGIAAVWAEDAPFTPPIPSSPIQVEEEILVISTEELPGSPDENVEQKQNEEDKMDMVIIETSKGNIKVKLNAEKAPITVVNFLGYVDQKHYDGTIFHRVIANFMIQGGGFDASMRQKPTRAEIKNEAANGLSNKRGTIAMARTAVVDSATSQFFINVVDNNFLDFRAPNPQGFGYCVFGEVVEGMDVVDAIRSVPTGISAGMQDVPKETIEIISIRRAE